MKIVIVKYNAGNTSSVSFALSRLGIEPVITGDVDEIKTADKVILPGVGAAGSAMDYLRDLSIDKTLKDLKQPLLGICLGMQLMCSYSEEGDVQCMSLFDERVVKMQGGKIPHIGWNEVTQLKGPLLKGLTESSYMYFVHSYCVPVTKHTAGITEHVHQFSAAIQKNNFYGVQFHPEKSGDDGLTILKNFIEL